MTLTGRYKTLIYILLTTALMCVGGPSVFSAHAYVGRPVARENAGDSLTVSLVTCYPGPEIFELCGHEAIRIRSARMDSVWNYGLFSFDEPNFVYRFVKGETDYRLGGYPFEWFLPEYQRAGRRVVEQQLNLTQAESRRLLAMLHEEERPENNTYRYNYVLDNCATRPLARIDSAVNGYVVYPDSLDYGTFRREMRAMHRNYPWYQFGIDIALGSGIDRAVTPREEMFVPTVLMQRAENATLSDGRRLVAATNVLNEGGDAVLPPTPWWQTPLFWAWVMLAVCAATAVYDMRRHRLTRIVYSAYFLLVGIAGCVVWFLTCFSEHEATSPNALRWWLTPLGLVAGLGIWFGRCGGWATRICVWLEMIGAGVLLIVWPMIPQSTNAAIFPLMGCCVVLGAAYAAVTSRPEKKTPAPRTGRPTKRK